MHNYLLCNMIYFLLLNIESVVKLHEYYQFLLLNIFSLVIMINSLFFPNLKWRFAISDILEDPLQVMYKKCSIEVCTRPVCQLWSYNKANDDQLLCSIHQSLTEISNELVLMMDDIKQDLNRISPQVAELLMTENFKLTELCHIFFYS